MLQKQHASMQVATKPKKKSNFTLITFSTEGRLLFELSDDLAHTYC